MVEGAPLLRAYRTKSYRGFESLSLRQTKKRGLRPRFCLVVRESAENLRFDPRHAGRVAQDTAQDSP